MDYNLVKQLKDAGFPQLDLGGFNHGEDLNYPTLSELIEACGDDFLQLQIHYPTKKWSAWAISSSEGRGSTPKEAVALLWLALNDK